MKKITFLLGFLFILSACDNPQSQKQTENTSTETGQKNIESVIVKEHDPKMGTGCSCPSCLGLVDEKDYFLF